MWLLLALFVAAPTAALRPAPSIVKRCVADALAGCGAGVVKQLAVYPLDAAATRLETRRGAPAETLADHYRGAGVVCLFALRASRVEDQGSQRRRG